VVAAVLELPVLFQAHGLLTQVVVEVAATKLLAELAVPAAVAPPLPHAERVTTEQMASAAAAAERPDLQAAAHSAAVPAAPVLL
jgi:hypothetical protein